MEDLIDDYNSSKNLPYDKVDSPIFRTMFDELARLKEKLRQGDQI